MAGKPWGNIFISTRLEKQVEAEFVASWTGLLLMGKRAGDAIRVTRGKVAHVAQNENVRAFLMETTCDTFLSLDSDADFEPDFLHRFRDYEPGWEFDALQAFHVRRGEPLEAIWLGYNGAGGFVEQQLVLGQGVAELGLVGTHCALFRREIFEAIYDKHGKPFDIPLDEFEWFTYPRHKKMSDEAQLAHEARELGFLLGGTTDIRIGHITRKSVGWDDYQQMLQETDAHARADYYLELSQMVADFTGEPVETVRAKALVGNENVKTAWERTNPQNAIETRAFYGNPDNGYLYDLLHWNWDAFYWRIIRPLKQYHDKRVLVIGAGLGTEAEFLKAGNTVHIFELPGILRNFCNWRFGKDEAVYIFDRPNLGSLWAWHYDADYDLIVCIDTLEHIHPDEIQDALHTIDKLLAPGGIFYCHNNWKDRALYPMHFDHSAVFEQWLTDNGMERIGNYEYRKPEMSQQLSRGNGHISSRERVPA